MNFSTAIKQSNTDEWFTTREDVERIVPYLVRGGTEKSFVHSIKQTVIMSRCLPKMDSM